MKHNGLESGHFIPKHPKQLVDHQHHLHDGCCQRWRMNEWMMNHHETSWMNHTSWGSSWWLWIFMILVRHDLPDSTCTSLMNRWTYAFPPMLGSPNPRNEWIAPEVAASTSSSTQLWWLIFFLGFYKIFHHGICYQYVNSLKFHTLQKIYLCLSSAANIRFYS